MNAQLFFVDESATRSDAHRGATWGPVGETPVVKDSGGRFGVNRISGVRDAGICVSASSGNNGFVPLHALLKQLHHDDGGPIQVVADNAKYRHSKATGRFVEEQGDPNSSICPRICRS